MAKSWLVVETSFGLTCLVQLDARDDILKQEDVMAPWTIQWNAARLAAFAAIRLGAFAFTIKRSSLDRLYRVLTR